MDKKLSFVLPIYNVEAYLPQCIDSILHQATPECEIILVDDGSPDGSGAICDAYAEAYSNVQVIHKENGGLASARNAGLARATGEYVLFVDSDDYIEAGSVKKLLDWTEQEQGDVCFLELTKVYPDGTRESMGERLSRERIRGQNRKAVLSFLAECPKFPGSACGKLLRRAFLEEKGIRFPDDRRLSEDLRFCQDVYLQAERFDYLDFPYYCYRQSRTGSITSTVTPRYYFDTFRFVTESAAQLAPSGEAADEIAACALSFAAYEYAILVWQLVFLTGGDRRKAKQLLKAYRWVLQYGRSGKTRLVRTVVSLCGLEVASQIMNWYMTRR